ncbi:c-type cytochrome [Chloroflexales bacterium ZM16-3]|nr:c-type cytochrome [Chloroflexales bacterium ZM16-3]
MKRTALYKKLSTFVLSACLGLLCVVLMAGCGQNGTATAQNTAPPAPPAPPTPPTPTVEVIPTIAPERLAAAKELIIAQGCVGCHAIDSIPEAIGIIGPNLTHIFTRAADTITTDAYKATGKATTARDYLQESILTPSAYVAAECPTGPCVDFVMTRDFKTRLKPEELETILDLLSTLK